MRIIAIYYYRWLSETSAIQMKDFLMLSSLEAVEMQGLLSTNYTGWWFGTVFIFHYIWDNPSHWLLYFSRWFKPPTSILVGINRRVSVCCFPFGICLAQLEAVHRPLKPPEVPAGAGLAGGSGEWGEPHSRNKISKSHMLHVWYIYLHLGDV